MKVRLIQSTNTPVASIQTQNKIPAALIGLDHPNTKSLIQHMFNHPHFILQNIYHTGKTEVELQDRFPEFRKHPKMTIKPLSLKELVRHHQVAILGVQPCAKTNALFLPLRKSGIKILDLMNHTSQEFKPSIGLSEIFAEDMRHNYVVCTPHPASIPVILALAPFLQSQSIATDKIIIDIKSSPLQFGNIISFLDLQNNILQRSEFVTPYKTQMLKSLQMLAKDPIECLVQHSVLPIRSGIQATVFVKPFRKPQEQNFHEILQHFYQHYPFVIGLPVGTQANLQDVQNTNQCQISFTEDLKSETLIITAVVDEDQKATSGNAIQCLNTMFDFSFVI